MVFAILVLLTGLSISAVAGFYSIVGLTTIFSGSVMAVAIMGTALEIGKLVTASWLYRNWKTAGFLIKTYLTIAVTVLMFITSMGIFGYLSKAHLEQTGNGDTVQLRLDKVDFEIAQQNKRIDSAQGILSQFDAALEKYFEMEYITRGLKEREKQKPEREALQAEIEVANNKIEELSEKRFEYNQSIKEIEVEVGPLKYIAELVYGEEEAKNLLDEAVRGVILVLIFVFDPLAVLLLIAANMSIAQARTPPPKPEIVKEASNDLGVTLSRPLDSFNFVDETIQEIPIVYEEVPAEMLKPDPSDRPPDPIEPSHEVPKPEWAKKVISKSIKKRQVGSAIDTAFTEAKESAQIPFNLDSKEGELLKKLIVTHLTKTVIEPE